MIVSYKWLQNYFEKTLPAIDKLKEGLTLHAFEIEKVEEKNGDYLMDIDVLPNRAHDCLSHYGIAQEIKAIFGLKIKEEYLKIPKFQTLKPSHFKIKIADEKLCRRYSLRVIKNIKIKPSPDWLGEALETIGQKSINNIVDVINFIMFDFGQPMHAFDLDKIAGNEINVRLAKKNEKTTTLDNQKIELDESILIIADNKDPLAIAGIKGSKKAEVDEKTTNIILESANFEPTNIRKTSQRINIQTDSSKRFENEITSEITREAIERATFLIKKVVGENIEIEEMVDIYPKKPNSYKVGVGLGELNDTLGLNLNLEEIKNIFSRLDFKVVEINNPIGDVLERAQTLVGVPYKMGSSITYDAPRFFDCSAFISFLFAQVGVAIPRITVDQFIYGEDVLEQDLKPGDLVFSNTNDGSIYYKSIEFLPGTNVPEGVDHSGLYLGDGKIIHASRYNNNGILIEKLKESKQFSNITGYKRIIKAKNPRIVITVPSRRLDIRGSEDLIEEAGRIYGYSRIKSQSLKKENKDSKINHQFYYINRIRQILEQEGFFEVYTYSFTSHGQVEIIKPLNKDKGFLRPNITTGLINSLNFNLHYSDLIGVERLKIFEIGKTFKKNEENLTLGLGVKNTKSFKIKEKEINYLKEIINLLEKGLKISLKAKFIESDNGVVIEFNLNHIINNFTNHNSYDGIFDNKNKEIGYKIISPYPFVLRDIAIWTTKTTQSEEILHIIKEEAGKLLVTSTLFDRFEKDDRVSYAFKLVFQSQEKTLSDEEINKIMDKITQSLNKQKNWEVR